MKNNTGSRLQIVGGIIVGFGVLLGANAFAADTNPCSKDMARFCKNIQLGTSAMIDCLETHEDKISNACKDYETKMGGVRVERKEEVRDIIEANKACRGDVAKFCKDVNPAQDGIAKCLKANEKKLSAACRKSIQERNKEETKMTK